MASRQQLKRPERTTIRPADDSVETVSSIASSNESYERLRPVPRHQEQEAPVSQRRQRYAAYTIPSSSSISSEDSVLSESAHPELIADEDTDYDDSEADDFSDSESEEDEDELDDECLELPSFPDEDDYDAIPPVLPAYSPAVIDTAVRSSSPESFAKLFPSVNRLYVHHDDLTHDGNMNLRVDTRVPGSRHNVAIQLFHLRMHDLARREFSLRRYCRESGREVANSKRNYAVPPPPPPPPASLSRSSILKNSTTRTGPALRRSVSNAIRSVKTPFSRNNSSSSVLKRPLTGRRALSSSSSSTGGSDKASMHSSRSSEKAPSSVRSTSSSRSRRATNSIRLEFSNYARVDISRKDSTGEIQYGFDWWGSSYVWERVVDKHLGTVSFHLIRDGQDAPVAHVVPETRGPNQIQADEWAGGWVPPCHMWISDETILDALTDVTDVIVATGLIALVDDSIKQRWQVRKPSRAAVKKTSNNSAPSDFSSLRSRAHLPSFFNWRQQHPQPPSTYGQPMPYRRPVAAY